MADVDDCFLRQRLGRVRRQEGDARRAKRVDDWAQFVWRHPCDGREVEESARPADRRAFGVDVGQFTKHQLHDARAPFILRDRGHHRVGVAGEELGEAAGLLDDRAVEDRAFAGLGPRGLVPNQHQAVLQQRQLVLAAAHRSDQARSERLVDKAAVHLRGAAHGAHERVVVHARHQILGSIDGLGEPVEMRAFAEEFRAHRDDDMHFGPVRRRRAVRLPRRPTEQVDKQLGFFAACLLFVTEDLLELVDQHAHALARQALDAADHGSQARLAAVEEAVDRLDAVDIVAALFKLGEFGCEIPQRAARRPHRTSDPRGAMAKILARELGQDARADELDLPDPEAPWTTTSRSRARRSITSSIMRSRPKKIDHSFSSNGRSPGYGWEGRSAAIWGPLTASPWLPASARRRANSEIRHANPRG